MQTYTYQRNNNTQVGQLAIQQLDMSHVGTVQNQYMDLRAGVFCFIFYFYFCLIECCCIVCIMFFVLYILFVLKYNDFFCFVCIYLEKTKKNEHWTKKTQEVTTVSRERHKEKPKERLERETES